MEPMTDGQMAAHRLRMQFPYMGGAWMCATPRRKRYKHKRR